MTENRRNRKKRGYGGMIAVMLLFILLIIASTAILFWPEDTKKTASKEILAATPTPTITPVVSEREHLAVVLNVDTEMKLITLYDVEREEELRLIYTGATTFYDGYGVQQTAAGLKSGDFYEFVVNTKEEWITTAREAVDRREKPVDNDVWEKTGIDYFKFLDGKLTFRDQNYQYRDSICVMNNGEKTSLSELQSGVDIITVRGKGQTVYEVVVTKGHGYISLQNHEDFIGGMITIGSTRVDTVSEEATYLVREGTYEVTVEHGEYKGSQKLTVARNTTAEFDVYEYGSGPVKKGWLTIQVEPMGATLYVDGVKTYYTDGLELDYGVYRFEFAEGGYISYKAMVQIDQPKQSLSVFLSEQTNETSGEVDDPTNDPNMTNKTDTETSSGETNSGDNSEQNSEYTTENNSGEIITPAVQTSISIAKLGYKINENNAIYILGPVGAEIYLDGTFLGTAPIDFEKIIGSYVITIITEDGSVTLKNMMETDNGADSYYNFSE